MIARWVGFILIVLGWFQVIPLLFGWIGFGLAAISFVLESTYKKNVTNPNTGGNPGELSDPKSRDKNDS